MRQTPRFIRHSGFASAAPNVSRSTPTTTLLTVTQCPRRSSSFSSSSQLGIPTPRSRRAPTSIPPFPPSFSRLYSSVRQQTPAPVREQVHPPPADAVPEPQPNALTTDEITNAEREDLEWAEERGTISEGPYTTPPPRLEAARANEVADVNYVPASFAEGLETVGGLADWWDRPSNWTAAGDYVGFRPRLKVTDPVLIEASVRRAVIEAFALREAGREDELVTMWPTAMPKNHLLGLLAWEVKSTEDGGVTLGGDPLTVAEGLRWNDKDYATTSGDGDNTLYEPLTPEEAYALSQTWGSSWKSILLADPRIRFAITKRVFQLTGQSVTDRELSSITTVHNLIRILKKPPKPATLTQEIQERHLDLLHLPNVAVASKRVTRGDKEKALGRFKLMQEEFRKRNMPAYGHGNVRKGKEISRLRGGT